MKNRLFAAFLSVSLLFGSLPVNAAGLETGNPQGKSKTSFQEEVEPTEFLDDMLQTYAEDVSEESEDKYVEGNGSGDKPSVDDVFSDDDLSQDNITDENGSDSKNKDNSDVSDYDKDSDSGEDNNSEETIAEDTEMNSEGEAEAETVEDESLVVEKDEEDFDVIKDEVIELTVGYASITLPGYYSYDQWGNPEYVKMWYSFTAPEEGYYNFHINSNSSIAYSMSLCTDLNGDYIRYIIDKNLHTNHMNAGETVYIRAYEYTENDNEIELDIHKLTAYDTAQNKEDGSYIYDTPDYTLSVLPKVGFASCRVTASLEAKDSVQLDSSYHLVAYAENTAYWDCPTADVDLNEYGNYKGNINIDAEMGKEYSLHFLLVDNSSNYNVLAMFDSGIKFTTDISDESVVIYETTTTESSITIDLESKNLVYCYYAPTDGSEEEKSKYVSRGLDTYGFYDLVPNTEYYFQFVDSSSGKVVCEIKESTEPLSTQFAYTAEVDSEWSDYFRFTAEVSNYKGNATYAYLYYEYTDALGRVQLDYRYISISNIESDENNAKSFTVTDSLSIFSYAFEADTFYDFTMWVDIYGDLELPKETKTLKTPQSQIEASDLTFEMASDNTTATTANYTVSIDLEDEHDIFGGLIYYKPKDSKDFYRQTGCGLLPSESSTIGSIENLQLGVDYDFILFFEGIKKESRLHIDSNVTLSQVSSEINAFDFLLKYEVKSKGTEGLADSYTLKLYYLDRVFYYQLGNTATLNAENQYQAEIKTASTYASRLDPDTDYNLKCELYNTTNTSDGNAICTLYQTIHTPKANITLEPTESSFSSQKFRVTFDRNSIANFDDFGSLGVYADIRKKGNISYRSSNIGSIELTSNNDYSNEFTLSNLEERTEYNILLRDPTRIELIYVYNSFTTPADERLLTITVTPNLNSARLNYSITGVTPSMFGYVYCYIREAGSEVWERADWNSWRGETSSSFNISTYNGNELKADTAYDYKIGFSDSYNASLDSLEKVKDGTFTVGENSGGGGGNDDGDREDAIYYTITVDKADGSAVEIIEIFKDDELTIEQLPDPVMVGYEFISWVDENGNKIELPFKPTGDMTITATWNKTDSTDSTGQYGIQILGIEEYYYYTGANITPSIDVVDYDIDDPNKKYLTRGTDYTVKYKNNKNIGTAQVIVTFKGNYSGKNIQSATFSIVEPEAPQDVELADLKGAKITKIETGMTYDGNAKYPNFTLQLKNGLPVEYSYSDGQYKDAGGASIPAKASLSNNINKGTATLLLTGKNGSVKKTFKIKAIDLAANASNVTVVVNDEKSIEYAIKGATPGVEVTYKGTPLIKGKDYTVKYSSNKKVGVQGQVVITGKGNYAKKYTGTKFDITQLDLSTIKGGVSAVTAYKGVKVSKIKATVVDSQGNVLKPSQYTLKFYSSIDDTQAYQANDVINAEKVYVEAEAKDTNNLKNTTIRTEFSVGTNIASAKVYGKNDAKAITKEYTGDKVAIEKGDMKLTLKIDGVSTDLKWDEDYEIVEETYSNNINKGNATVVIRGKGEYSGTKTIKFKITPKSVSNIEKFRLSVSGVLKNFVNS